MPAASPAVATVSPKFCFITFGYVCTCHHLPSVGNCGHNLAVGKFRTQNITEKNTNEQRENASSWQRARGVGSRLWWSNYHRIKCYYWGTAVWSAKKDTGARSSCFFFVSRIDLINKLIHLHNEFLEASFNCSRYASFVSLDIPLITDSAAARLDWLGQKCISICWICC